MTAIRIVLDEGATMPRRATAGSAGLDLCASRDTWVPAGACVVVPTGVRVEIPHGYEGQVRGRSGLTREGLLVHLGTIDSDYRGEIGVIVSLAEWAGPLDTCHNEDRILGPFVDPTSPRASERGVWVSNGDRIAQLVIAPVWMGELEVCAELPDTERGERGFGSTGER